MRRLGIPELDRQLPVMIADHVPFAINRFPGIIQVRLRTADDLVGSGERIAGDGEPQAGWGDRGLAAPIDLVGRPAGDIQLERRREGAIGRLELEGIGRPATGGTQAGQQDGGENEKQLLHLWLSFCLVAETGTVVAGVAGFFWPSRRWSCAR